MSRWLAFAVALAALASPAHAERVLITGFEAGGMSNQWSGGSGTIDVESSATTLPEIIQEMLLAKTSERQGRVIDNDDEGSMEEKKREGYF